MKLLLDTHAFLWFIMGSPQLSEKARALMEDGGNERLIGISSLWEMAIKTSMGKLHLAKPFATLIPQQLRLNGIGILNIEVSHLSLLITLPFRHRDPFDRILVAQALAEDLPIVSSDPSFDEYAVRRLW